MTTASRIPPSLDLAAVAARYPHVFKRTWWSVLRPGILPFIALAYVVYAMWFFQIGPVLREGHWERAPLYLADFVSYSIRGTLKLTNDSITVAWPRFSPLGDDPNPDWVQKDESRSITAQLAGGAVLVASPSKVVVTKGSESLTVLIKDKKLTLDGQLPSWGVITGDEIDADFGLSGGVEVNPTRIYFNRRFIGWPNFIFAPESKFWNKSFTDVIGLLFTVERLDPARSNLSLAWNDFVTNSNWQHGDIWNSMLQTVVMAFAGTVLAALTAFPMSFLAARNLGQPAWVSSITKQSFSFLRSIDGLIWALFFVRAFGLGPIPGIFAIFLTDIGSLGKLYSEALENLDKKQREGIESTGAPSSSILRFGVLPQVLPIFASQALYHWESNTRSATIIGAVGAGGIGMKLWEAMLTRQNWANVLYMVLIILAVVYVFDNISSFLRRRLIGEQMHG